jgi:hypothetical protein
MQTILELSADELAMLEHGQPLRVRVNDAHEVVLVLAEQYERLKQCVDFTEADPKALYPLISEVSPGDWEELSAYPDAEKL